MPTPKSTVWACDPHTVAKHQILRSYLDKWLPILLQGGYPGVTYAEGFAGSGVYEDGEPGSPVVAFQTFLKHKPLLQQRPRTPVDLLLIEENPARLANLKEELRKTWRANKPIPPTINFRFACGDHSELLLPRLKEMGVLHRPVFAFLDSWGGPDVPLETARAIAAAPASEVFVTFGTSYLIRFGDTTDGRREEGDRVFGGTSWRKVFSLPKEQKKRFLVETYRQSLRNAGFTFVTSFEMQDEKSHDLHLVHGTRHIKGLEKMKDAMWEVDPVHGVRFRDPRDSNQAGLFEITDTDYQPLRRALLAELSDGPRTIGRLQDFALRETVYRPAHAWQLINQMLTAGELHNLTEGRRRKSSLISLTPFTP